MKHINEYKIFESIEEMNDIKLTLEEILLVLNDIGFETEVYINYKLSGDGYIMRIYVKLPGKTFKIDIIKETFLRIEDYLSSIGECEFDYQIDGYQTYDFDLDDSRRAISISDLLYFNEYNINEMEFITTIKKTYETYK